MIRILPPNPKRQAAIAGRWSSSVGEFRAGTYDFQYVLQHPDSATILKVATHEAELREAK